MKKRALRASYEIVALIRKHLDASMTPAEHNRLEQWLQEKEAHRILFRQLADREQLGQAIARFKEIAAEKDAAFERISSQLQLTPSRPSLHARLFRRWPYAAAAAVLLCLGIGAFFYLDNGMAPAAHNNATVSHTDILPGGNKATLTLGNGDVITLDSVTTGTLARQGNTTIIQLNSGQLAYKKSAAVNGNNILYNTIATPRGGQYQVVLPDGSLAWLNAASSLRFPTTFTGNERKVQLRGEAYFEVAPLYVNKKKRPFIVEILSAPAGSQVEVLGTHFNVMAYDDESSVKVTLLTGQVKVSKGTAAAQLTPGQQARLDKEGQLKIQSQADVEEALAWKNGLFQFHSANLPTVMRQLSRWYDVDVVYKGAVPSREFEGEIERSLTLSQVLRILEKNQVHITIAGKQMIVTP